MRFRAHQSLVHEQCDGVTKRGAQQDRKPSSSDTFTSLINPLINRTCGVVFRTSGAEVMKPSHSTAAPYRENSTITMSRDVLPSESLKKNRSDVLAPEQKNLKNAQRSNPPQKKKELALFTAIQDSSSNFPGLVRVEFVLRVLFD